MVTVMAMVQAMMVPLPMTAMTQHCMRQWCGGAMRWGSQVVRVVAKLMAKLMVALPTHPCSTMTALVSQCHPKCWRNRRSLTALAAWHPVASVGAGVRLEIDTCWRWQVATRMLRKVAVVTMGTCHLVSWLCLNWNDAAAAPRPMMLLLLMLMLMRLATVSKQRVMRTPRRMMRRLVMVTTTAMLPKSDLPQCRC